MRYQFLRFSLRLPSFAKQAVFTNKNKNLNSGYFHYLLLGADQHARHKILMDIKKHDELNKNHNNEL